MSDILSKAREIPRGIGGYHHDIVQEMISEIERLTAERDEARRMFCDQSFGNKHAVACELGWSCYTEPAHAP